MFQARSFKHCKACGAAAKYLVPADDNRERAVCTVCANVHYENPLNVVGTVPHLGSRVLLCKRNIEPRKGKWTLPAGFMELQETTAQGAATSVWAATAPFLKAHGGRYLEDCQLSVPHLPTTPFAGYAEYITDPVKALKLWDVSESLLAQVK